VGVVFFRSAVQEVVRGPVRHRLHGWGFFTTDGLLIIAISTKTKGNFCFFRQAQDEARVTRVKSNSAFSDVVSLTESDGGLDVVLLSSAEDKEKEVQLHVEVWMC
jgi:hypothetical protein